ncbi:MAG: response regulator [Caldilineaceae bacterium SB0675_bin_29]|uniref:histidine kinase n=1 Tax=Caldilineaceae bacterium SB0675_bin_29 TaxID=2605266 RepID=A0A6B1G5Y9_9CHLR|nr:response regulator [Caldilineaceae bacterium SB0675_bin_29]
MKRADELAQENTALRERLSRLSEASHRINESLDFGTVLTNVLESACALTGGKSGVITLLDDSGQVQDFFAHGISSERAQSLWNMPQHSKFLDYLGKISEPMRVKDLKSYARDLGFSEFPPPTTAIPVLSLLMAPILHLNELVGHIYVGEKGDGREFTLEDEEVLVVFASQAALAIANARRYREEQETRAYLETLINTSPVGVAVFNAKTGKLVSYNRETERMFMTLSSPGYTVEELLKVMTVRRASGWEYTLAEGPVDKTLRSGETVRSEEVVYSVPDGRSLTALVNGTPIRSDEGDIISFVFTLQDMAPLKEMERMRAEFLAMVSHELRTPLSSVKGSITTLLDPSITLNPAETDQFHQIIDTQTDRMRELIADLLDVARIESGTLSVLPKPAEVVDLIAEAQNAFQSGGAKHELQIEFEPDLPLIMADRLRIIQVLSNLLSNAARYSPERLPIRVSASREGLLVVISVSDKGQGIPAESLPHLFGKFSRNDAENQSEETGLGLAICKGIVEAHGGRIWAESDGPGTGTTVSFTIPAVGQPINVLPAKGTQPLNRSSSQAMEERMRILVVDDDLLALRYVRDTLAKAGYTPIVTGDPQEALVLMYEKKPRLALLDLMLPGTDGIDLMKEILEISRVPVIFLSAYDQDQLIARAFDMGAADYVVKPFSPTELTARIRGALRKWAGSDQLSPFVLGEMTIDYVTRQVTLASEPVRLTAIEYRTLVELSQHAGQVVTYEYLLRKVWEMEGELDLRPMRTVISTLRRRLNDDAVNPTYIFTEPRVGYRFANPESRKEDPHKSP